MTSNFRSIAGFAIVLALFFCGCSNNPNSNTSKDTIISETERGEHSRDKGGNEEGKEDGTELGLKEEYNVVKKGVHLILAYDNESNSFIGTVENTTEVIVEKVRVEVHLLNGIELGPTIPADLKPGEKAPVKLKASDEEFEGWTTHAEVGSGEHGGEGEGEHD